MTPASIAFLLGLSDADDFQPKAVPHARPVRAAVAAPNTLGAVTLAEYLRNRRAAGDLLNGRRATSSTRAEARS